jgi:adsorption protein A
MKPHATHAVAQLPSRRLMALLIASCMMSVGVAEASTSWLSEEISRMRAYPRLHTAHQAILKQDYRKAAIALDEYLRLRPNSIDARLLYLDVLYQLHDRDGLVAQTDAVLAKSPSNTKAIGYRQWLNSSLPQMQQAVTSPVTVAVIEPVRQSVKKPLPVRSRKKNVVTARMDSSLTDDAAASVMVSVPPNLAQEDPLANAYAALDAGRTQDAIAYFHQALKSEPKPSTHLALARTYATLGDYGQATEHYANAIADDALSATADHEHGNVLALQGKPALAYSHWLLAERVDRSVDLQMKLAYVESMNGEDERALKRLEAIDMDGQVPGVQADLHYRLAELSERSGDIAQAKHHLMLALAVKPSAAGYYRLALFSLDFQDWQQAKMWLERAIELEPSNMLLLKQLGYVCKTLNDNSCVLRAFDNALNAQPGQANIEGELGYAYTRIGQNASALSWFRRAIDSYNAGHASPGYLQPSQGSEEQATSSTLSANDVNTIRRQVREMNRGLQFNAYQSYRPGSAAASTGLPPGFTSGGAIPSQGGIELLYQPAELGYRDGRTLRLFARTLWSNHPKSLAINADTLQGGVGIEYKPLKTLNAYLSLERLIKIGDQAQDNTLLRASWGYSDGYELKPGVEQWNYTVVYADAGYLLEKDRIRSAYMEVRQGRSFNMQDRWTVTPHLSVVGRTQAPDPQQVSYAELGAGVSWKVLFNETVYETPRSSLELTLQFRKPLDHDRASGWVLIGALRY